MGEEELEKRETVEEENNGDGLVLQLEAERWTEARRKGVEELVEDLGLKLISWEWEKGQEGRLVWLSFDTPRGAQEAWGRIEGSELGWDEDGEKVKITMGGEYKEWKERQGEGGKGTEGR